MSAKKAPVRKPAAKKISRKTAKPAAKNAGKKATKKAPAKTAMKKVAKKAATKAKPKQAAKKVAKKVPKKAPAKKAVKKTAQKAPKPTTKKVVKKVAKKATKTAPVAKPAAKKSPAKKPLAIKKPAVPKPTVKKAAVKAPAATPLPAAEKAAATGKAAEPKSPAEKAELAPMTKVEATPVKPIAPTEKVTPPAPVAPPKDEKPAPKEKPAKKKAEKKERKAPAGKSSETPPFSKEVLDDLAVTPAIPIKDMPVLVCIQDPQPAPGIMTLVEDSDVPATSGIPTQQWRLHAVLEQNPPRFFEGWATSGTFTLDVRVNASVKEKSGNWGGHTNITSGAKPCRVTISIGEGNTVKFSAIEGVQHATAKHMPSEARYLIGDIAFTTKENGVVEVAATSVICTEKWSHLVAHTEAANKGLAFDTRWGAKLKANDGFTVAAGVWSFAVMTRGEYEDLRSKKGWPVREVDA